MATKNIQGPQAPGSVIVQDAQLLFRNFAGKEKEFNSAGDRNFCLLLPPEMAEKFRDEGWNVKELKARDEGDQPQAYVQVTVQYNKGRPPRCVMITSRGRTDLGADEVEIFDYADIKKVDLILSPYSWSVNGNTGVKAYLKSIFVTIDEDELDLKYADLPDASASKDAQDEPDDWNE